MRGRRSGKTCAGSAGGVGSGEIDAKDYGARCGRDRGGVIGLMLYNGFLKPGWKDDQSVSVTLDEHLRQHANYIANLSGWEHLGVGSDLDGGFGLEESPSEIDTVADLHKVGLVVPDEVRGAVLGTNWLNFLRSSLPQTS